MNQTIKHKHIDADWPTAIESISESLNQSMTQSINKSLNQSTNHSKIAIGQWILTLWRY